MQRLTSLLQSVSDVLFPAELGEKEVKINSRSIDGDTPLHVLTYRENVEGVKLLVNSGADINAAGDMGETALHAAVRQNNISIIKTLLSAGADINKKSEFGLSPKELANTKSDSIRKLFENI